MSSLSPLSSIERQNQILQLIARFSRITINEVCETFSVSQATARRDLEALSHLGKLQRVHGGAIPIRQAIPEPPIMVRSSEQEEEKQRIGRLAAGCVDHQIAFKDSAVGQHHGQTQNIVPRHAIFQTARPAGVARDVAADGGMPDARRVGRIKKPDLFDFRLQ